MNYGREIGLIGDKVYEKFENKITNIEILTDLLKNTKITPKADINNYLVSIGSTIIYDSINLYELLKRPEIEFANISRFLSKEFDSEVVEQVVINIKYEGYISKELREAKKMLEYEKIKINENIDYNSVPNLAKEAIQKLNEIRPVSIGQALRISGVNPSDISMLLLYLKRNYNE